MTETDQNRPIPGYPDYMQSQRELVKSSRVGERAAANPLWKTAGRAAPADPAGYFAGHLDVQITGEYMLVTVSDPDPVLAATALRTIVDSFVAIYHEQESHQQDRLLEVLENLRMELRNAIDAQQARIDELAREYGTDDLGAALESQRTQIVKLTEALIEIRKKNAAASGSDAANVPADVNPDGSKQSPANEKELEALLKDVQAKFVAVANSQLRINEAKQELSSRKQRFSEVSTRIDDLRTEALGLTRVNVISVDGIPKSPYRDRRLRHAAFTGAAAAGIPIVIIMGGVVAKRRRRNRGGIGDV
jgi:hypothetical protein